MFEIAVSAILTLATLIVVAVGSYIAKKIDAHGERISSLEAKVDILLRKGLRNYER